MRSLLIILTTTLCINANVLDIYDSYVVDEIDSSMSSVYVGPLVATGGAIAGFNYITNMQPQIIGSIEPNKIILTDSIDEVYSFKTLTYFKVSKGIDTFYVMKIESNRNNEKYDIIIELRDGPNYDRTLNIYKNGKPYVLILWKEKARLRVNKKI